MSIDRGEADSAIHALIAAVAEGLYLQSADGAIVAVNLSAERLLGWPREDMLGRRPAELGWAAVLEDGSPLPAPAFPGERALRSGRAESGVVMRLARRDGTRIWLEASARPCVLGGSLAGGVATTLHDLTRQRDTEASLRRSNRELHAISECNQVLLRADNEQTLLDEICRIVCSGAGYRLAWVGYAEQGAQRRIRTIARAGVDDGYLEEAALTWADEERGRGPAGIAIRSGRSASIQDFAVDPQAAPWRAAALRRGYRSCLALPLKDASAQAFGVLVIYSDEPDAFTPEEVRLMEELAGDLAYGVAALRTREGFLRAEARRLAHLRLLEGMDRVNRAIQGAADLERMMREVLDAVLDVFDCDRAFLMYPCDPEAASWSVPMERTRPDYPGAAALKLTLPMTDEVAATLRPLLAAEAPLCHGPGHAHPVPPQISERYSIRSYMALAIRPKFGKPWQFGVHQCRHARLWTADDQQLFQEIGRRVGDALTSLLVQRDLEESAGRLRTLVQTIPDLVWLKDPQGVYLGCNREFERLMGAPEADIVGKTDYEFAPREQADFFRLNDRRAIEHGAPRVNEEWLDYAGADYRGLFETVKTPMFDAAGKLIGVLGIARDITARHRSDEQLRIAAIAFEAQEGIWVADAAHVILRVNRAFTEITGYSSDEAVGQTPGLLQSDRHSAAFHAGIWGEVAREDSWQGEVWNRRRNGEVYPEWLSITAVRDAHGAATHYVGTFLDITARKAAEREIEHLAFHDVLTGLPNRRLLKDRLHQALGGSARSGQPGALMIVDLDNFKIVNDTSGHGAGDRLLAEAGQRLVRSVRENDSVARLGGDEFVVMIEDLHRNVTEAAAHAMRVGEKIRAALNEPYELDGRWLHISPSIGVTLFAGTAHPVDELLKQADIAMYQAKAAGRNALRLFDPQMQAALQARVQLEAALRLALRERQFELHYQPQYEARQGLIGAEALLRWNHPQRGRVGPVEFIALAEETGLIVPIGQWVLETACARLAAWSRDARLAELQLSVNVSAQQFREADFVACVQRALAFGGAPARRLKLELTESLVLHDVGATIDKMHELRALGVGISVDDFGTGYSSLAYLTRLPLDQLKIDRSFVRNLPGSAGDAAVVQAVIALARSLGLAVVAEGVETEEQRAFLEQHGCTGWQGYLFGRPTDAAGFERLLG